MTLVWMVLDNNTNPCPVGRELPQLAIFPRMGQDSTTTTFLHSPEVRARRPLLAELSRLHREKRTNPQHTRESPLMTQAV